MAVNPRLRLVLAIAILAGCTPAATGGIPPIETSPLPAQSEKEARTPAQQKINSQLLYEIYRRRGIDKEKGVPDGPTGVRLDARRRALVDVRAEVTPGLLKKLRDRGSEIVTTSPEHRSVIAWVPVLEIERLAEDSAVRAVEPAPEGAIRK